MPRLTATAADLRDPGDSEEPMLKIKCALDCDGSVCGALGWDERGEQIEADPHFHLVASGRNPAASPRYLFMNFS